MDIKLEKKPWYVRHRYRIAAGAVLVAGLIYVAALASGPQKLRIDAGSVQIAEVKNDDFMEYVDVEGVVHPILTLMVNVRESGNVERIVAEEGSLMKRGDTILTDARPGGPARRVGEAAHLLRGKGDRNGTEDADPEAAGFGSGIRVEQNPQEFRAGRGRV